MTDNHRRFFESPQSNTVTKVKKNGKHLKIQIHRNYKKKIITLKSEAYLKKYIFITF